MLKYHEDIINQCLKFDGLWVLAPGLGVLEVIENLLIRLGFPQKSPNHIPSSMKNSNNEKIESKNNDSSTTPRGNIIVLNLHPEVLPNASPRQYIYVNAEYNAQQRKSLYLKGGVIFGTSVVLIVDLLKKRLPPHLIAGFIIARAEHIIETSTEGFILRFFRKYNKNGFIKAFSDNPIALTNGFHKVEKVMKCLYVTKLFLWPRFHQSVKESLEDPKHKPEVLEFTSTMTPTMEEIHKSIITVMNACIKELQRISSIDTSDLTIENNLFKSFHNMIKNQLEPIWHKLSPKTKQLVHDLALLRKLLQNLVRYDCVSFNEYLESLQRYELGEHSPWIFLDEADRIFELARKRVYLINKRSNSSNNEGCQAAKKKKSDEITVPSTTNTNNTNIESSDVNTKNNEETEKKKIDQKNEKQVESMKDDKTIKVPSSTENIQDDSNDKEQLKTLTEEKSEYKLVLEEHPKWKMLRDILDEITKSCATLSNPSAAIVFVRDERTCLELEEFLTKGGRQALKCRFKRYLQRKKRMTFSPKSGPKFGRGYQGKKVYRTKGYCKSNTQKISRNLSSNEEDTYQQESSSLSSMHIIDTFLDLVDQQSQGNNLTIPNTVDSSLGQETFDNIKTLNRSHNENLPQITDNTNTNQTILFGDEYDKFFGIIPPPLILLHSVQKTKHILSMLEQIRPQFVVLFEPEMSLIRQIEIFKARHKGHPLRIYLTTYKNSIEEQKFKSTVRKEQEAFEKLIKEKATMVIPEGQDGKSETTTFFTPIKSSRKGVGTLILKQPKILVDTREFRSKLPSLIHARGVEVVPVMLDIGDYILSKDICVERKSISDLYQSFSRGRLYNQIEMLCRTFQTPILLIEFSENQSFCLQNEDEIGLDIEKNNIISKLVLLIQHFPKLKLLWSKSPYETVEIFMSLKENKVEPSEQDIPSYVDESPEDLGAFDPLSLLRRLPGINEKNIHFVTEKVQSLVELATLSQVELSQLIGEGNSKQLMEFLDKNEPTQEYVSISKK